MDLRDQLLQQFILVWLVQFMNTTFGVKFHYIQPDKSLVMRYYCKKLGILVNPLAQLSFFQYE